MSAVWWCLALAMPFHPLRRCPLMTALLNEATDDGMVVDVGANGGCEVAAALRRGRRVLGVECLHSAYAELLAAPQLANATLVHGCASNRTGLADLHLALDSSSLIAANLQDAPERRKVRAAGARQAAVLVPLDALLDGAAVAAVKLDVQGGEFEALQGLRATLARDRPAIAYEDTPRFTKHGDPEAWLAELGYRCKLLGGDRLCTAA